MKRLSYILPLISLFICNIISAQPAIKFEQTKHDFDIIEEDMGKVECLFNFTNTGNEPIVIKNVRTSCGCTVPEYTEEPIAPKASGTIKVTFNPMGRPGKFNKSIYVYTNTDPERSILRIMGEVVRSSDPASTQFAYRIGDLKFKSLHMSFPKLSKGRKSSESIEVINTSGQTLTPQVANVPSHLRARFVPDTLPKGEKGYLVVTYDTDAIDDWGYRKDEFQVEGVWATLGDTVSQSYNTIAISGTITDNFDILTKEQLEKAPILIAGQSTIDFGVIEGTKKASRSIYIVNTGYSPLYIRKITNENKAIETKIKKQKLNPGQSTTLTIEIDPNKVRSNIMLSDIFIISNDPKNPSQDIRINAEFR